MRLKVFLLIVIMGSLSLARLRTDVVHADSIVLSGGSYLKTYVEGSFPCTLKTSDVTVQQVGTAYYSKIGNRMHITFPVLFGTSNSSALSIYCALPYLPIQQSSGYGFTRSPIIANDNGAVIAASASWNGNPTTNNRIIINPVPTAPFTSSGTKGLFTFELSYITE